MAIPKIEHMTLRTLGRTEIPVSPIGFGTWGIGGLTPGATSYGETDDDISISALIHAVQSGINFFDTAPAYGGGHSEALLGRLISKVGRDAVIIATKGGCENFAQSQDFSIPALRHGLEQSLNRLRSAYVDLYQLHNPSLSELDNSKAITRLVHELKSEKKISAFGVSIANPSEGLVALECFQPDSIQVNFNLLDQRALDNGFLDAALKTGTSVIARTPLCFGILSGQVSPDRIFPPEDHRCRWPAEQIRAWAEGGRRIIQNLANTSGGTPSQLALRFCLSFPAITSAIPGMMHPKEVDENAAVCGLGPLTKNELDIIRGVYEDDSLFLSTRPNRQIMT